MIGINILWKVLFKSFVMCMHQFPLNISKFIEVRKVKIIMRFELATN